MNLLSIVRLFRMILSPRVRVDATEIERMGLLAVKIAQMYAVRSDLIGVEKCQELSRLLQHVTPLPFEEFKRRFDAEASPALKEQLASMEQTPLAAASLGQVHRARLKSGQEVVVKVVKQDSRRSFAHDLRHFRFLVRLALLFYPKLERLADPMGALETVERNTIKEMDLRAEIQGAARLQELADEAVETLPHLARLKFPRYFPELSNTDVLVTEFIDGRTLGQWIKGGDLPYDALLELFRIHGYFLFARGEFHGDIHPGNIIWREDGIWFLDNANIERIAPEFSLGILEMLLALAGDDFEGAARQLESLSTRPLPEDARHRLEQNFVRLYSGFGGKTVSEVSLTNQMMQTVRMAVEAGMTFPKGAFPLIKSLMYLDGMVVESAPDAILLRDVARFADDFRDLGLKTDVTSG